MCNNLKSMKLNILPALYNKEIHGESPKEANSRSVSQDYSPPFMETEGSLVK
jgi:hypothetical protein